MKITLKNRKAIHFFLFISIIALQITAFTFWLSEIKYQDNLYSSIENIAKPNQALGYSNQATKNLFEANNYFNEYLNNHTEETYLKYRNSLKNMSFFLDKLSLLSNKNNLFSQIIKNKRGIEKEIINLKSQLDLLINKDYNASLQLKNINFDVKTQKQEKVLSSITYDTTRTSTKAKKKGLFERLGNAIVGKTQIEKQEVRSKIKMVFNNEEKTGSIDDQIRYIIKSTEKYYEDKFSKLKLAHLTLKNKDQDLLEINKNILIKSQEILLIYSSSAQETSRINYINSVKEYNSSLKDKKKLIFTLLLTISIVTLLLLLYTIYSYTLEKNLEKAKGEAEINLDKKNQLIGLISHEMRAPLNIISNFSKKIKKTNTNPDLNTSIESLYFTSNSLQITVNQILDFFKNENKKLLLYKTKVNLKAEITSILESLQSLAELKQIKIISNMSPDLNEDVWTDNVKIHQLFYNLIGNAIKFTKKGTITVDTQLTSINEQIRFDVKITDTGAGIPKEEQDKIFDKFYQSKVHKEQINFGAGLGLTLCKNIIELFHGNIKVESEPGKGTEISFFLLLDKINPEQETNKTKIINQFSSTPKEVVVIDDDPMTLVVMEKLIKNINFKTTVFLEVDALKKHLANHEVDIIITDLQIYDYSGFDLIKEIKKMDNQNAKSPIIVLTGDSYMISADLKKLHIDEILIKPVNNEELYDKILKVLNR